MIAHYLHHLGARLHYRLGGQTDASVLVLLHGGFGSTADFDALLPRLQAKFRLLAIDTRGHGGSTLGDAPLSYAQAADDVRHILRHEGIARCHLFGFSDGGITAYRLAADDNDLIDSVVTVGADWHRDHLHRVRPMYASLNAAFVRENMPAQLAAYLADNPEPDAERWVAALKTMWLDEGEQGYPNERMGQIRAPVLAVRGDGDFLYHLADWAALKNVLSDVHLLNVPLAAHEVIREQPDILWAALQAFWAT
ncbi:MAG: alpha/beta fold hydrolase [Eikenella sp.]|nr:alpha/beta fold hydrolase [Eikenella sp.]